MVPSLCAGNCDLVSCSMLVGEKLSSHFMVFNETEFLLVNPHKSKLGFGVVDFIAFLQVKFMCVDYIVAQRITVTWNLLRVEVGFGVVIITRHRI